ncbi:hypothetical protein TCAL_07064 [Tigriopus californicus]|uniref:Sphingomyelin phosphodiesterase n=1 Tax=Tigriopus californicus TaxID=6832 RepID=A0A553PQG6_TIGCA|nr:sphingomyelin phosphodiesterase-like [Tigriopus californicus]TRY79928.1 hypothetical protein TCAL_07064 [Tigriopus californicus]|eukprot:TCALIF_07064-PA protein Name:"Similar to Smpd1 Sphingomyelin phosphodiesterase (Mus musculus)" AED:0.05 eAED:0.05 QI:4/1/0.87/1/0.85/0.75/8/642/599
MGQQTSPSGLSFVLVLVVCSLLPLHHVQGKPNLLRNLGDKDTIQESHPNALTTGFRCMVCHWGAALMVDYERAGRSKEEFLSITARLCSFFGIHGKDICHGMVHNVGEQMFHIMQEGNGTIHAWDICALVEEGQCTGHSKRINNWSLKIPDLNRPQQALVPRYPVKPVKTQKILHLSDPHVQRDYQIGANAECGEPVCCARINGYPVNRKLAADKLGDYRCDLPPWTLDAFMNEIRQRHPDIDYIFVTGDYPAHDVWRQNRTGNLESTKVVVNVIQKHFPNTPVFPTIGNHEAFPVNMFPDINETGRYNPGWLYANLAKFYKDWLPGKIQQKTIKRGGYYSTHIRPGVKLISVNTNVCNNFNFWLLLDFNDPIGHLHWIYKELHKAELNKEKVFIIGHIPPGTKSCYNQWAHEYGRIVHRFNNTILGQFFGHTHFDEFEIFHNGRTPISMAYLAPSLTPGGGLNPAYRIYEIDGNHNDSTNLILDHSTSYFDLQASIQASSLVHVEEYSAKKDFHLHDLSPQSWRDLVFRMAEDEALFKKFLAYFFRFGPALANPCGVSCQKEILCQLSTGASGDQSFCLRLEQMVDKRSNSIWSWIWS